MKGATCSLCFRTKYNFFNRGVYRLEVHYAFSNIIYSILNSKCFMVVLQDLWVVIPKALGDRTDNYRW